MVNQTVLRERASDVFCRNHSGPGSSDPGPHFLGKTAITPFTSGIFIRRPGNPLEPGAVDGLSRRCYNITLFPAVGPLFPPPNVRLCNSVSETTLERIAAGDSPAVDECLRRYGGLVWSLARKFCPNYADAEDAVQEVFIEVWRHAGRFDPAVASEATYITMIARRRLIDRFRRRGRELDAASLPEETIDPASAHEARAEIEEEAALAREYLGRLRPEEREVLEFSITHGLSQSQIAEATDLPLGTVKTHARRGLIRLRELLGADRVAVAKGDSP